MGGLGSELAGDGVAGGIDASSCFPQRPKREGYGPGLTPFQAASTQAMKHKLRVAVTLHKKGFM